MLTKSESSFTITLQYQSARDEHESIAPCKYSGPHGQSIWDVCDGRTSSSRMSGIYHCKGITEFFRRGTHIAMVIAMVMTILILSMNTRMLLIQARITNTHIQYKSQTTHMASSTTTMLIVTRMTIRIRIPTRIPTRMITRIVIMKRSPTCPLFQAVLEALNKFPMVAAFRSPTPHRCSTSLAAITVIVE